MCVCPTAMYVCLFIGLKSSFYTLILIQNMNINLTQKIQKAKVYIKSNNNKNISNNNKKGIATATTKHYLQQKTSNNIGTYFYSEKASRWSVVLAT